MITRAAFGPWATGSPPLVDIFQSLWCDWIKFIFWSFKKIQSMIEKINSQPKST